MPFDALPAKRQAYLLQKLDAVAGLLSEQQKWCQNRLRGPDGSRCLVGALVDAQARLVLYHPLLDAVKTTTGMRYARLEDFNDAPATDFARVQAVRDRARLDIVMGVLPHGFDYAMRYRLARFLRASPRCERALQQQGSCNCRVGELLTQKRNTTSSAATLPRN